MNTKAVFNGLLVAGMAFVGAGAIAQPSDGIVLTPQSLRTTESELKKATEGRLRQTDSQILDGGTTVATLRGLLDTGDDGRVAVVMYITGVVDGLLSLDSLKHKQSGQALEFPKFKELMARGTSVVHPGNLGPFMVLMWQQTGGDMDAHAADMVLNFLTQQYGPQARKGPPFIDLDFSDKEASNPPEVELGQQRHRDVATPSTESLLVSAVYATLLSEWNVQRERFSVQRLIPSLGQIAQLPGDVAAANNAKNSWVVRQNGFNVVVGEGHSAGVFSVAIPDGASRDECIEEIRKYIDLTLLHEQAAVGGVDEMGLLTLGGERIGLISIGSTRGDLQGTVVLGFIPAEHAKQVAPRVFD
ncbi:MAG: hypothetical protein AAF125_06200 [Chloroflexota bacterium]